MWAEIRKELRFYFCMSLGFTLMILGFYAPPIGYIENSVLIGSGMFLVIGGLAIGLDIKGIIHEVRLLKKETLKDEKE